MSASNYSPALERNPAMTNMQKIALDRITAATRKRVAAHNKLWKNTDNLAAQRANSRAFDAMTAARKRAISLGCTDDQIYAAREAAVH